ncbi:MAG: DUF2252 domain-containing protein [Burkholderiaceae bacterium]|nr:DUF2252 domain-containing protein [Microbacteriaceae bacterium]
MTDPNVHVVHSSVSGDAYASLRRRPTPRTERFELGRRLRDDVPREALGTWVPRSGLPGQADVVSLVTESHQGRDERLIPLRVARMTASPYGFLRGSAIVMAADLATLPSTGITPVICGDAHVGNFGFYASPERDLVIDLNDFDEAHPGPWEWDLRRLAASIWVAGRQNGFTEEQCQAAVESCARAYRDHIRELADQPLLSRSFQRVDVDRLQESTTNLALHRGIERAVSRARRRTSDRALPRFATDEEGGDHRIVEEPPLITHVGSEEFEHIAEALDEYLQTLAPHWRRVLGGYTLLDLAHKVVGVGSVGLRAFVALCEGSSPEDVLFLQLKQARRSVIAPYVHGDSAWHAHQGQRVVEYQQALQTVSDPLLGWTTVDGRQYYVRQFRNMKGTLPLDDIGADAMVDYVAVCGRLLAKGHARTSGASMIAGYAGRGDKLEHAIAVFARSYADQTEADHAALIEAVRLGRIDSA